MKELVLLFAVVALFTAGCSGDARCPMVADAVARIALSEAAKRFAADSGLSVDPDDPAGDFRPRPECLCRDRGARLNAASSFDLSNEKSGGRSVMNFASAPAIAMHAR